MRKQTLFYFNYEV